MNNVLVLSAGRRVELVRALKELKMACPTAATFAIDSCRLSAACHVADNFSKAQKYWIQDIKITYSIVHDE